MLGAVDDSRTDAETLFAFLTFLLYFFNVFYYKNVSTNVPRNSVLIIFCIVCYAV